MKFSGNNSTALLWDIIKGAGIGWSPTYVQMMGPNLVPLDIDAKIFPFDIWFTHHLDATRVPRVRWMIERISIRRCFRGSVTSSSIRAICRGFITARRSSIVNFFEGLTWEGNIVKL